MRAGLNRKRLSIGPHCVAVSWSIEESGAAALSELSTADHAIAAGQPWRLLVCHSENLLGLCKLFEELTVKQKLFYKTCVTLFPEL